MALRTGRLVSLLVVLAAAIAVPGAHAEAPAFAFAAAGDFGVSEEARATLAGMAAVKVDFAVALGDLSYNGPQSEAAWCAWVKRFFPTDFPFQILVGNHEDDYGEDGHITEYARCLPDRLDAVGTYGVEYYFDYNGLARIILISPDLTVDGRHYYYGAANERYAWLADTIDEAREAGIPWVIVGMHKSCLSMGLYYCNIYQDLWSLLVEKKVDLILHANEHDYQRTHQIATGRDCPVVEVDAFEPACIADDGADGRYRKGAGVVSVVVGTAGRDLYPLQTADAEAGYFAAWMGANGRPRRGFLEVTVSPSELVARFVGTTPTSDFTDSFTIVRTR